MRKELEKKAWRNTSKAYRSTYAGERCVLAWTNKGTALVALSEMSEEELRRRAR
jgi:uncharacterized membrane protein YidH (DUF202 family)